MRLQVITTSEIRTMNRCKRLHWYKYQLGYRPVKREHPLSFGSVVHAGLETWWATAGDISAATEAMVAAHAESELGSYDLIRADVMLSGYHARWIDEPIEVVGAEVEFRVPIRHPDGRRHLVDLAGKLDAVARINGCVYLPEHKTKSELTDDVAYFEQLAGDDQVSNYMIAATEQGHEPGGVLYDVLVKPPEYYRKTEKPRYRKDGQLYSNQRAEDEGPEEYRTRLTELITSNPDAYYSRATIRRSTADLTFAKLDLWHAADAIIAAHSSAYHPRNPGACRMYGRTCSFFDVCFQGADIQDSTRFTKLDNPHQELTHAISNSSGTKAAE